MTPKSDRAALFPGSFNPFTRGHASLVSRGLGIFDRIVIAVGYNESKGSRPDAEATARAIRNLYAHEPRVEVTTYSGLTADEARRRGIGHILRGVRGVQDFEYERNMADINRRISGVETVLLFTLPELACVSSSAVRELMHFGADVSQFLPDSRTATTDNE